MRSDAGRVRFDRSKSSTFRPAATSQRLFVLLLSRHPRSLTVRTYDSRELRRSRSVAIRCACLRFYLRRDGRSNLVRCVLSVRLMWVLIYSEYVGRSDPVDLELEALDKFSKRQESARSKSNESPSPSSSTPSLSRRAPTVHSSSTGYSTRRICRIDIDCSLLDSLPLSLIYVRTSWRL